MSRVTNVFSSSDLVLNGTRVFRIWQGKLRLGELTYRDPNAEDPRRASVAVVWDDGSTTTTKAGSLRYISPDADLAKIEEVQMLFNEYGIDISSEASLLEYYLEQTGDEDEADQLAEEAAHYGRQLTTQQWVNITAATAANSVQYGDFIISRDLGGDGYNIYIDGELWDEGYGSIQKAMQAIDDSGENTSGVISAETPKRNVNAAMQYASPSDNWLQRDNSKYFEERNARGAAHPDVGKYARIIKRDDDLYGKKYVIISVIDDVYTLQLGGTTTATYRRDDITIHNATVQSASRSAPRYVVWVKVRGEDKWRKFKGSYNPSVDDEFLQRVSENNNTDYSDVVVLPNGTDANKIRHNDSTFHLDTYERLLKVTKGSSINADSVKLTVIEGWNILFSQDYHYGYDCSYDRQFATETKPYIEDIIQDVATEYGVKPENIIRSDNGKNVFRDSINSSEDIEDEDTLPISEQEFTSERTSINSTKLPAVYKMINIPAGQVGIDYGGGKFDNAVEYMAEQGVTLVVYDPYNRTAEHNKEAIRTIRANGGADFAICSNVLNVIKEANVREEVLQNMKKLLKPSGKLYLTVYEGKADRAEGETKSGYQLNRPTSGYLDEIREVFPDAVRKGKLITATPNGTPVQSARDINAGELTDDQFELLLNLRNKAHEVLLTPHFGFPEEDVNDYYFVEGKMVEDAFVVEVRAELDYDSMMDLADELNPVIQKVDRDAYFDMEEPGIMSAYLYHEAITSAQYTWHNFPELPLDPPEPPDNRYDMEEELEFEFDLVIDVDDTGYYEYTPESQQDFHGDMPGGAWWGREYSGYLVRRPSELEEHLDALIGPMLPEKAGRYRIRGTAYLVYEIEGVEPETDDMIFVNSGEVSFCFEKSRVEGFQWEPLESEITSAAQLTRPDIDLNHGYFYAEYNSGAKQITKARPYDDADYYYALRRNNKWLICKSGKIFKTIDQDEFDYLDEIDFMNKIADELEMVNSNIRPRMMYN